MQITNPDIDPALFSLKPKSMVTSGKMSMEKIDATAKDFEAMFMTEMLRPMFEGIEVDPTFGGGKTEEVFRDFMLDEYGKQLASTGTFGIADLVKKQLIEMQEHAANTATKPDMAQNMHNIIQDNAGEV